LAINPSPLTTGSTQLDLDPFVHAVLDHWRIPPFGDDLADVSSLVKVMEDCSTPATVEQGGVFDRDFLDELGINNRRSPDGVHGG
jgi:hypothetical protein